jgi:hypothetical protein
MSAAVGLILNVALVVSRVMKFSIPAGIELSVKVGAEREKSSAEQSDTRFTMPLRSYKKFVTSLAAVG